MNTAFDPATAERTVIDRAEFARLIRKHRSVHAMVFAPDYVDGEVVKDCADGSFGVAIPAKQAIEKLNRGDFDAFVWEFDQYGPSISTFKIAAPWLQISRRRQIHQARITSLENRLALPAPGTPGDVQGRAWVEQALAGHRAALRTLDARRASLRVQSVAA